MTIDNLVYESDDENWSFQQKLAAWFTHLFTASGSLWGLMALIAITNETWVAAFAWMGVAVFVDSFDGLIARRARVKDVLPNFDGALLDNIIDFLNYVVVPAYFLYQSSVLPQPAALISAALILIASSYQFCQADAKTDDHFFKGFPSYWNVMVYYMFLFQWNEWVNLAIILVLSLLVFVPIKYVYPSRTEMNQRLTMSLALVWGVLNVVIMLQYPNHHPWLVWGSLLYVIYYCGLSIYAMLKTDARQA
jgi:phosphatidylcholine synthase